MTNNTKLSQQTKQHPSGARNELATSLSTLKKIDGYMNVLDDLSASTYWLLITDF